VEIGWYSILSLINLKVSFLLDWLFDIYHVTLFFVLVLVLLIVLNITVFRKSVNKYFTKDVRLEFIWAVLPLFLLAFQCGFSLLFVFMEDSKAVSDSFSVLGNQWYWDYCSISSNMKTADRFRLVSLDFTLKVIRRNFYVSVMSRRDVLHSWALPSLGTKLDVVPGRLDVLYLSFPVGSFFGFCSELCGAGHSFIPILVESGC